MSRATYSVGLDVGGTKVHGLILDDARIVKGHIRLPTVPGSDGVVATAKKAIANLSSQLGIAPQELSGVGVGIPGLVDPRTGRVVHAVNLQIDGEGLALASILRQDLGIAAVHVENDVNAAALGASDVLNLDDHDLCYLSVGTGLAAGLVFRGTLIRGMSGAAGEVGHIPVDPAGMPCACGQRGCLETRASGSALARQWPTKAGQHAPAELFAAAASGNEAAARIRDDFADGLAQAVQIIAQSCDVEVVAFGGGVSAIGEVMLDAVRDAIERQSASSTFLRSLRLADRLRLVPLDQPVAAIGAAIVGINGKDS